jgi:hypothetical protein
LCFDDKRVDLNTEYLAVTTIFVICRSTAALCTLVPSLAEEQVMKKSVLLAATACLLLGETALAADFHTRVYKTSTTFTIPSSTGTSTDFEFTIVGGGGGAAGDCSGGGKLSSGGGAGAAGNVSFSGFNPDDTVTITIGAGGAAGTGGSSGGTGGTTKLTYAGVDIATATGGTGSVGISTSSAPGVAGSYSDTVGTTGLNRHSTLSLGAQNGGTAGLADFDGGGNGVGVGGKIASPDAPAGGGGGAGCYNGFSNQGGAGGDGYVIIHWAS